jgi:NADH-quinone oxidoreductase subunit A
METEPASLWPLALYFACALGVALFMVGLSYLLGQRRRDRATSEPYESGIVSFGSARLRFTARFYLVAMFFVIFDLEAVFIVVWAVAVKELGWTGYFSILVFIALLAAALVYLWRIGALDWGPVRSQNPGVSKEVFHRSHDPIR